jgi:hypothetical protein
MLKVCAHCGAPFHAKSPAAKFCSRTCSGARRRLSPAVCSNCGGQFRQDHNRRKFCSASCYSAHRRPPRKPCEGCGRLFQPKLRKQRFCSLSCTPRGGSLLTLLLDDMRTDYARGMRVRDIVEKYGFDLTTIYRHLDRDGRRWTRS